jgi:hypothetical protein
MMLSLKVLSAVAVLAWNSVPCQSFQSASPISRHSLTEKSYIRTTRPPPPTTTTIRQSTTTTALQAASSPLVALASSPLGAVSVLAAIVVIHEAGQYVAARSYNILVEEFSVGFGPKLTGFSAFGNDFNVQALPLGGYV